MCLGTCGRNVGVDEVDDYGLCVTCSAATPNREFDDRLCSCCGVSVLIFSDELINGFCDTCEEQGMNEQPWYLEFLKTKNKHTTKDQSKYQGKINHTKFPVIASPKCTHNGSPKAFTIGKGTVYAGGDRDFDDWDLKPIELIVKLNGHPSPVIQHNDSAVELLKDYEHLQPTALMPYLSVSWPDMGEPPLTQMFVTQLVELVTKGTSILVHCLGGHGRTGTLLTALAITSGKVPAKKDPILWIREIYCQKAVESKRQIEWLEDTYKFKADSQVSPISTYGGPHTFTYAK